MILDRGVVQNKTVICNTVIVIEMEVLEKYHYKHLDGTLIMRVVNQKWSQITSPLRGLDK